MSVTSAVYRRRLSARPDLLALQARFPHRYPILLESAAHHPLTGRYDLLPAFPETVMEAHGQARGFLAELDAACCLAPCQAQADELPFVGGWVVYLGYELAGAIETSVQLPLSPSGSLPTALAWRCPAALIHDRLHGESWAVAERAGDVERLLADLAQTPTRPLPDLPDCVVTEEDPARYLGAIARAQRYIRDGDVFQANLSRCWRGEFAASAAPEALHARLRRSNPAPYAALLRWRDTTVLSTSPECLLRRNGDLIQTRPIAGTHPRDPDPDRDRARALELLAHPKERAEHVMLVDLERNDLGRICQAGSVRVSEQLQVETYAHVHHIVSAVEGRLRSDVGVADIVSALFPGGTITGCPKVRCMQIIAELEGEPRGPYTGAIGYISRNGRMDFNILIRTAELAGRNIVLRAGGGIVADSDPERELAETRAKAKGLLRALMRDPVC